MSSQADAPVPSTPAGRAPASGGDLRALTLLLTVLAGLLTLSAVRGTRLAADSAPYPMYARKFFLLLERDLVQRDALTTKSSAYFRKLEQFIAPDAKIFAAGLGGPENGRLLGHLFIAIYYLFPRQIDVSLDRAPQFQSGSWFAGADTPSDEALVEHGYDLRFDFEGSSPEDAHMTFKPLNAERAYRPHR